MDPCRGARSVPGCAGRRVCAGRWSRVRRDEALGEPWWDRAGTGDDSWGWLGPCTDVPEFSVVPLQLSSVWSPSPSRAPCVSVLPCQHGGGSEPPPHPSAFPTWVPPFCFSFLPGAAVVLLQGQGDPVVTSRSNLAAASTPCGQLAPSLWSARNDHRLFRGVGERGRGDTKPNDLMNEE